MKDFFNEFKLYLKNVKRSSNNTIESYSRDLFAYINYANKKGIIDLSVVSQEFVTDYIKSNESCSNASISRTVSSIKCYYRFLQSINLASSINIKQIKSIHKCTKSLPVILEKDEIEKLISAPDTSQLKGIRDKAMIELLYATGITVTELINLDVSSLNVLLGLLCVGGRTIPIYKDALRILSLYINQVRKVLVTDTRESALFCNLYGEPLTRQGVWKIIKECAQTANINKVITPHTIRHSFAVHLLENGADIITVNEILGHTSKTSAQMYIDIIKNKYNNSYIEFHPKA